MCVVDGAPVTFAFDDCASVACVVFRAAVVGADDDIVASSEMGVLTADVDEGEIGRCAIFGSGNTDVDLRRSAITFGFAAVSGDDVVVG